MAHVNIYIIGCVICLQSLTDCIQSTIGQYIYSYYLLNFNKTNENSTRIDAQAWAQAQSADLVSKKDVFSSFPLILMTFLLGLYINKLGRKCLLICSIFCDTIQMVIWLLIIYLQLDKYWWYISSFISSLAGSDGICHLVLNLYVTDCTKDDNRSISFVVLEAIKAGISSIGNLSVGYYISHRGFIELYYYAILLQFLSILIAILFFKHSSSLSIRRSSLPIEIYSDIQIGNSCCSKMKFPKKNLTIILLILFSYLFSLLSNSALWSNFLWYLLNKPFNWSSVQIGTYNSLRSILTAIFSICGMKFFVYMSVNDSIICSFSHISFIFLSIWLIFAKQHWHLYITLLIIPFLDYQNSLTWSMITKFVTTSEYHLIFTILTMIETMCTILGDGFFNWIYELTVNHLSYFVFIISAGLSMIPLILNIHLFIINRRSSSSSIDINNHEGDDSDLIDCEMSVELEQNQGDLISFQ
ncbi:unnamed protein product [Adineta ricciae]|uniref:Uncharacterized protein n=1 Tax=Adineta ricciae TaxID=249248 RepID=A0A815VMH0_ADIRI|nr:unnamed protein product [Adineta ricciae]CAF1537117.1 unnamed protein product [Adineta ricciae]